MKTLPCRDIGFDCSFVVEADSEEQVLAQADQHAAEAHQITVTDKVAGQVRTLIRDSDDASAA